MLSPRLFAVAIVITGLTFSLASQREVLAQSGKGGGIGIESLPCAYNFTSGSSFSLFKWCLTSNGNIGYIESPEGSQHVYTEGYGVCGAVNYYDYGFAGASGFGPPTIVSGCTTGSACTLRRDSVDGRLRLKMAFTQNKAEKEITVVHTITNLSTQSLGVMGITRKADLDMQNSDTNDQHGSSFQSAWMNEGYARIGLTALTLVYQGNGVSTYGTSLFGGRDLSVFPCGLPEATGDDFAIGQIYSLSKLGSQQSRSFKFQYRRD